MKILKGLALSFLSFLLFLSLSVLGLTFMLNNTLLNPAFVTSEIKRLNISPLVEELLSKETNGLSKELKASIVSAAPEVEPLLKEQISAAVYPVYDYLLGKDKTLDLASTLRNTILKTDFVVSLVDKLDLSSLAKEFLRSQAAGVIPPEVKKYLIDSLDKTVSDLKPWIKQQASAAADPVLNYLLGKSESFSVSIPLGPAKEALRVNLKEAFLKSPPPEVAWIPPATLGQYFDTYYQQFSALIPSTFVFDQRLWGSEIRAEISGGLAEAERTLEQAKTVFGYCQLIYQILIGLVLLLILCIILIHREVKGASRRLGTTFLTYGVFEYAAILVAKYLAPRLLPLAQMPPPLQTWLPQFINNCLAPLGMFSLGLLIAGIILLIVSFVYKPRQAEL